jgi:hypothetical protein
MLASMSKWITKLSKAENTYENGNETYDDKKQNWCGSSNKVQTITNSVAPEPEGSSPYSQQPATGPYPEPTGSNLHSHSQSP